MSAAAKADCTVPFEAIARAAFLENRTTGEQVWRHLGELQRHAPVYWFEEGAFWVVTGFPEARTVLGAPGATLAFHSRNDRVSYAWREHASIMRIADWYAHKEGEDYSRPRKTAFGFFTPAVARSYAAFLERAAREVVDEFKQMGGGDVLEHVGYRLTTKITDHLLGLDERTRPDFRELIGKAMLTFKIDLTDKEWAEADAASDEMRAFWLERIEARRRDPVGDDVIARIIRDSDLTAHEIVVLAENILLAGSDTTANTTANGVALLLANPVQAARARTDARLRSVVPDEILRLGSPGPTTWRGLMQDLTVGDVTLPGGALVCVVLGSANRDPRVFPTGHEFDLDWYDDARKRDERPMPFGLGQHMCLGKYFVRAALGALFDQLLAGEHTIQFEGEVPELSGIGLRHAGLLSVRFS